MFNKHGSIETISEGRCFELRIIWKNFKQFVFYFYLFISLVRDLTWMDADTGHEESYNPPVEYIPTAEEVKSYESMYEEDRPKFIPTRYFLCPCLSC